MWPVGHCEVYNCQNQFTIKLNDNGKHKHCKSIYSFVKYEITIDKTQRHISSLHTDIHLSKLIILLYVFHLLFAVVRSVGLPLFYSFS